MRNLDKVADYFLDDKEDDRTITKFGYSDYSDVFIRDSNQIGFGKEVMGKVDYKYQDRLLRLKAKETGGVKVKDSMKKRYFASWGWFEDNILNNFFELKSGDMLLQTFRSSQIQPFPKTNDGQTQLNRCVSGPHLYSLGLDYTILPNQHPIIKRWIFKIQPRREKTHSRLLSKGTTIQLGQNQISL